MSASLRHKMMTIEDFLSWESRQEMKYEFDGFEPVAMAGGTTRHARLQARLAISVGGRLLGGPCEFFGSDLKVLASETIRYPDGQVVCGPVGDGATISTTPIVVFEVASPSSAVTDHQIKPAEYFLIATVARYLVLEQDRAAVTVMTREGTGWSRQFVTEGIIEMPEIGISVPVAELYAA